MKAYMSVPGAGSITHVPTYEHQAMCFERDAMQEATRIIRETEPKRDAEGWLTAHVPADFPEHGMHALAEALAAFCDDGQEARS